MYYYILLKTNGEIELIESKEGSKLDFNSAQDLLGAARRNTHRWIANTISALMITDG